MTTAPSFTGAAMVAGVAGWPVAHSLSPLLHGAWIAAAGLDAVYAPFAIKPDDALDAFRAIGRLGLKGLNVTVPHKQVALEAADHVRPAAERVGAANLLSVTADGALVADNTDVQGFLHGLTRAEVAADGPAAILGAGGAARAVIVGLADAGCAEIRLVNRSADKAQALAELAAQLGVRAQVFSWDDAERALDDALLLVNATSLGMAGAAPLSLVLHGLRDDAAVYDLVYTPRETALLESARRRGLVAIEGLDMLIGQARPSFETFFGAPPPDDVDVRALLNGALEIRRTDRA